MTLKEVFEQTSDTFEWIIVDIDVYDKKKDIWREKWPVFGAFYRDYFCGYMYQGKFHLFNGLDGTDEEFWPDRDYEEEFGSIRKLVKEIPNFRAMIKSGEEYLKKMAIERDFE